MDRVLQTSLLYSQACLYYATSVFRRKHHQIIMLQKHYRQRIVWLLILLSLFYFSVIKLQVSSLGVSSRETTNLVIRNPISKKPTILLWHPPFDRYNRYYADQKTCGANIDCEVTYDRDLLDKSDALVFHFEYTDIETLPLKRKPDQLYVWWSGEKTHGSNLKEFDNVFNLTFTYRRDSEVFAPYGSTSVILKELRRANEMDLDALIAKKKKGKVAAWAVSNCGVERRMKLGRDIMDAGLPVDTFGECFEGREIGDGQNSDSFYEALSEYMFYFAFENGYHCKDYITEKFWYNGFRSGAVPVVWGPKKEDVAAVAPHGSYIHVEDYESVDDLVDYLIYLTMNRTAYREHLAWRQWAANPELAEIRFQKEASDLHSFCKLCRIVQERKYVEAKGGKTKEMNVPSLHEWWWKRENPECIYSELFDLRMPQDGVLELLSKVKLIQKDRLII